jgi:glycosyltransferase involved in cell wall biosynthesis
MLKILLIFRCPGRSFFSIENVFSGIEEHMSDFNFHRFYCKYPSSSFFNIVKNIYFVFKINYKYDVVHITGDCHYLALFFNRKKVILTIHDCNLLERYNGIRYWVIFIFWYLLPILWSKKVVVISDFTKDRLIKFFGFAAKKILVVYNSVPSIFFDDGFIQNNKYNFIDQRLPRFLSIGTTWNKNLTRLHLAVSKFECEWIIIGPMTEELSQILKVNQSYYHFCDLSQEDVISIYKSCDLLLFPSLYEGFGLPIVEAQALGIPVLTSNIPPMKEIAGEGAIFVDPLSVSDIFEGMVKFISDKCYREKLVELGKFNANRFSRESFCESYKNLYLIQ